MNSVPEPEPEKSEPTSEEPATGSANSQPGSHSSGNKLTRLQRLEQKKKQVDAKLQQERSKEAQKTRKTQTRKKILIGSVIMNQVKQGKLSQDWLDRILDLGLTKNCDRRVFGLPEHPTEEEAS